MYYARDMKQYINTSAILPTELLDSGSRLNIKMSSYQYREPHTKDKTVLRPSYL